MSTVRPASSRLRYQLFGVVFLLVAALFVAGTIGAYNKVFTPSVRVALDTDTAGNQMSPGNDVKVHGVVVGEVKSIQPGNGYAVLQLALQPALAQRIPADVTAELLPTTLFGERYVDLEVPAHQTSGARLVSGDVIPQDRSASAVEIEQVLDDLMPVLQAVQPQDLSVTLSAVADAIQGRGTQLGNTLVQLDNYLRQVNPALPSLEATLSRISDVTRTYSQAAPRLLQAMDNLTTTSKTLVQQRSQLDSMLSTVTTTSDNLTTFLQYNQSNLINLATDSESTLQLLAKYAPEYPCMLHEFAAGIPTGERAFGQGTKTPNIANFTITITASHGKYEPGVDAPRYLDQRGPRCYPFVQPPNVFPQYPPGGPVADGSYHPPPPSNSPTLSQLLGGATSSVAPAGASSQAAPSQVGTTQGGTAQVGPAQAGGTPQVANSPAERNLLAELLAPGLGVPPQNVPQWSSLLVGPLYRGMEVNVR